MKRDVLEGLQDGRLIPKMPTIRIIRTNHKQFHAIHPGAGELETITTMMESKGKSRQETGSFPTRLNSISGVHM